MSDSSLPKTDSETPREVAPDFVDNLGTPTPADPLIGQTIDGKYVIKEKIGSGGMGAVYHAQHKLIDRTVAIKMLHAHLSANDELLKRFQHEARVASRLDHPNAIRIYDFGIFEGSPYLVMELATGPTLKDAIEKEGSLPFSRLLQIVEQIGSALSQAHKLGIVHRDLKPENILLKKDFAGNESAQLLDFGIAKVLNSQNDANVVMTRAGTFCGTPKYASPEQVLEKEVDHRADIYTLGIILYEALSGEVPFDAPSFMELLVKHVNEEPMPLRRFKPELGIAEDLDVIVMRCLRKKPEERYQSIDELIADLRAVNHGAKPRTDEKMKQGLSLGPIVGGMLALGVLLGGAYFALRNNEDTNKEESTESETPSTNTTQIAKKEETREPLHAENVISATPAPTAPVVQPSPSSQETKNTALDELTNALLAPSSMPSVAPTSPATTENEVRDQPSVAEENVADATPVPTSAPEIPANLPLAVKVSSDPSGAEVFVDGMRSGVTPIALSTLSAGDHTLVLKKKHFQDYSTQLNVGPNSKAVFDYTLTSIKNTDAAKKEAAQLYQVGQTLYRAKKYAEAAAKFEEAIELRSDAVASMMSLGNCYLRLGKNGDAVARFLAATRTDPSFGPAHYNLAAFYAVTGDVPNALKSLEKACTLDSRAKRSAKTEPDFATIKELPEFKRITGK